MHLIYRVGEQQAALLKAHLASNPSVRRVDVTPRELATIDVAVIVSIDGADEASVDAAVKKLVPSAQRSAD